MDSMRLDNLSELKPSRPMGTCCWCQRYKAMTDVRLGFGEIVFFDGDLCCFCLAELVERYPDEDKYLEALIQAQTPPELVRSLMQRRLVRYPAKALA